MDLVFKPIEWLMTIGGPVLIVYAIVTFIRTRHFVQSCAEAEGEIIRLERSMGVESVDYAPVFSFAAANGKTYKVTSSVGSSFTDFSVGERVCVRYDPANPDDAKIHTFFQTWGRAIVSGIVGVGFCTLGLSFLGVIHWFPLER